MRTPSVYASTKVVVGEIAKGAVKSVSFANTLLDYASQETINSMVTSNDENSDERIVTAIETSRQFTSLLNEAETKPTKTKYDEEQLAFEQELLAIGRANVMSRVRD